MNKERIRNWVEGQFYSDIESKELCEDYEDWLEEKVDFEIDRMTESLIKLFEEELNEA